MWVGENGGQRSTLGVTPQGLSLRGAHMWARLSWLGSARDLPAPAFPGIINAPHQAWLFTVVLGLELRSL